ncbi:hypothetical protein RJT34_11278 [Clitoria ternatea]|uniref:Uncharacterized protein n=1 Tax=Clitoria ternatea TaxID=43366 RepID=A0AAN9JLM6_CLITE
MAKYCRAMLVFGIGMLVVSMWCVKGTGAYDDDDDVEEAIHAVLRDEGGGGGGGCQSRHSDGVEECTDEDDHLGLYADVDDTFRVKNIHVQDDDDSSDVSHNNDELGH